MNTAALTETAETWFQAFAADFNQSPEIIYRRDSETIGETFFPVEFAAVISIQTATNKFLVNS